MNVTSRRDDGTAEEKYMMPQPSVAECPRKQNLPYCLGAYFLSPLSVMITLDNCGHLWVHVHTLLCVPVPQHEQQLDKMVKLASCVMDRSCVYLHPPLVVWMLYDVEIWCWGELAGEQIGEKRWGALCKWGKHHSLCDWWLLPSTLHIFWISCQSFVFILSQFTSSV